ESILSAPINRLSTGEKQRLGLLRLLSLEPQVLLLDEPTASLDIKNTYKMESLILSYLKEKDASALLISHDLEQIKRTAHRHLILDKTSLKEVSLYDHSIYN
ncbi:MAG: putative ABC transport system ATP-binding protein, partial [bacterium]